MKTLSLPVLALVTLFTYEAYALVIKRSGETAYLPGAADTFPSREVAGDVTLQQTFVMHADGLETIRLYPMRSSAAPRGTVRLALMRDNWIQPFAVSSWPADALVRGAAFDWHVPRVEESAGRTFTIIASIPDAPAGHGLRFRVGVPRYAEVSLLVGDRPEWGDLAFATSARRARAVDTISALRRRTPWLASDRTALLVAIAFQAAVVVLVIHALRAASGAI